MSRTHLRNNIPGGGVMKDNCPKVLGVKLCADGKRKTIQKAERRIIAGKRTVVFTPNVQMLRSSVNDTSVRKLLNSSDMNIPDGTGVFLLSRLCGVKLYERMTGIGFAESLLDFAQTRNLSVFLLGGKIGVAQKAAEELKKLYPALNICGTHHGYFDKHGKENRMVTDKINALRPQILLVCFGFPLQEKWIVGNMSSLPSVRLAAGLGGSLDAWSKSVKRAPEIWQKAGFEWLWRALHEPRRFVVCAEFISLLRPAYESRSAGGTCKAKK